MLAIRKSVLRRGNSRDWYPQGESCRVNSQRQVWMLISTLWLGWDFKTWVNVNEWNKCESLWLWCSCAQPWASYVILLLYTLSEEKTSVVQRFPSIETEWECLLRKGESVLDSDGEHCLCGLYNALVQGSSIYYQWEYVSLFIVKRTFRSDKLKGTY